MMPRGGRAAKIKSDLFWTVLCEFEDDATMNRIVNTICEKYTGKTKRKEINIEVSTIYKYFSNRENCESSKEVCDDITPKIIKMINNNLYKKNPEIGVYRALVYINSKGIFIIVDVGRRLLDN